MNRLNQARALEHLGYEETYPMLEKAFTLETKILLLINPNEELHQRVSEVTTASRASVFGTPDKFDPTIWNDASVELVRVTKVMIAEEWKRVKNIK